jgi:hypothetical protein
VRPLCSSARDWKLGAISSQQLFFGFHNQNEFHVSSLSVFQSQDLLQCNMVCSIYPGLFIYIQSFNQAAEGTKIQSDEHLVTPLSIRSDELERRDWESLEMHSDGVHDQVKPDMHFSTEIK